MNEDQATLSSRSGYPRGCCVVAQLMKIGRMDGLRDLM